MLHNLQYIILTIALSYAQTANSKGLKDALGDYFLVGVAINDTQTGPSCDPRAEAALVGNFNCIVAENCMKPESLQPTEGNFKWKKADRFVKYGEDRGLTITGHVLVWHSQTPDWFFKDENGNDVSRDVLIERMKKHIYTVVSRYRGRIKGWDVVNEAVETDGTFRQSPWYRIIGPEYIDLAFRFTHEADPDAELYYNDYSMSSPAKRETVVKMVSGLKEKGLRIDAIGMQSHNGLTYPDLDEYQKSIDAFASTGAKVMITELDINALPNPESFAGAEISQNFEYEERMDPYKNGLTPEAEQKINEQWLNFFRIYKENSDKISRVCLWDLGDGQSWLNDWPIQGRTSYPLLFDREFNAKPVVDDIIKMYE